MFLTIFKIILSSWDSFIKTWIRRERRNKNFKLLCKRDRYHNIWPSLMNMVLGLFKTTEPEYRGSLMA
jgi:hypothetical protein